LRGERGALDRDDCAVAAVLTDDASAAEQALAKHDPVTLARASIAEVKLGVLNRLPVEPDDVRRVACDTAVRAP
jgi:hypothetical protein